MRLRFALTPLALVALSATHCRDRPDEPPIRVDAGDDQRVTVGEPALLDGSRSRLSPLAFWLADGDGPVEDRLVQYDSRSGVRAIGPLRDSLNNVRGWPGAMLWVDGDLIGLDVWARRVLLISPELCHVGYLTDRLEEYPRIKSMAYDPVGSRLLVFDSEKRELFAVDLSSGSVERVSSVPSLQDVTGLVNLPAYGGLVGYDEATRALYRIAPDSGSSELLVRVAVPEGWICDEITLFEGEVYAALSQKVDDLGRVQVARIDLETGSLEDVGPVVEATMGHALVMRSIPERIEWRLVAGPGEAILGSPRSLQTEVRLSEPGTYRFALSVLGSDELVDETTVTAEPP